MIPDDGSLALAQREWNARIERGELFDVGDTRDVRQADRTEFDRSLRRFINHFQNRTGGPKQQARGLQRLRQTCTVEAAGIDGIDRLQEKSLPGIAPPASNTPADRSVAQFQWERAAFCHSATKGARRFLTCEDRTSFGFSALTVNLRPLHRGRHGRQDGFYVAAGLEAENGTAVVQEIEFDVATAADELFLAVSFGPRDCEVFANQPWVDSQECSTNVLCERKRLIPIRFEIIIKYAADAARFVSVLEKKIVVAPLSVFVIGSDFGVLVASCFHCGMKSNAVGIRLNATAVQHRCEVGAAAEP